MALTPCNVQTDVISELPDKPVTDGGLTSAQFKAKFDQVGLAIKNYLNQTLLPQIAAQFQTIITTGSLSGTVLTDNTVATAKIIDANITTPKIADGAVTEDKLGDDIDYESVGLAADQVRPIYVTDTPPVTGAADGIYLVTEE